MTQPDYEREAGNLCYYGHEHLKPNCPTCKPIANALRLAHEAGWAAGVKSSIQALENNSYVKESCCTKLKDGSHCPGCPQIEVDDCIDILRSLNTKENP